MNASQSGPGFSIALLGGGTVGAAVARGLVSRYEEWGIEIAGIAVRDVAKATAAGLDRIAPLSTDALALASSDVDLVVELMGGLDPALPVVETALKAGRPVVTANKLLLATFGARLEALARGSGAALRFESAVAAGVPIIGVLARDMAANEITSIKGIINGTTNYILTKMESEGWSYEQALTEAQKIGYAEADPRSDVEGEDAAAKLAVILARMAAGAWPALAHVQFDDAPGITGVQASDIAAAASRGARLRMLASWENGGDDASKDVLSVRVTEVPADSRLGTTVGGGNLIVVTGDLIGDLTLAGAGAGPGSTASGVISDILAIAGGEGSSWGEAPPADNAPAPAWFLAAKKKRGDA